jgi:membrane associated rhomboid family serine protease
MSIQRYQIRFGGRLTAAVKVLLIINASIFIGQQILELIPHGIGGTYNGFITDIFGLSHRGFITNHFYWQPLTYMFFHGGWIHIIFNMLALWMFGSELEETWGPRRFVQYYILSGIGAGFCIALLNWYIAATYGLDALPTIGASGALYALLLAYGLLWPNREILLYFLFPIKIKYLLIGFGIIEFFGTLSSITGKADSISHIGHIGGLLAGFLIFMFWKRKTSVPVKENFIYRFLKRRKFRRKQKEIDLRIKAKEIIDDLLDKIAREGLSALTDKEKKDLEWARKYYYPSDKETLH